MSRLGAITARCVLSAAVVLVAATPAAADRPAKPAERAAIMATVAKMGSFDPGPPACNHPIIRVSTWDPDYASWQAKDWKSGPCAKYGPANDGYNFFKQAFGNWLFLVRSPARPICGSIIQNVPFPVLADFLHCPGGPKMAQCFTQNGLGFQAANVSDAIFKVRQILQSCYARDNKHVARLGFAALPRPHGKAVGLTVKTRGAVSSAAARSLCAHTSIAARWYGYNVRVSVAGSGATRRC
jgi:hypothetical protein